jgi:hypothetical protein
MKAYHRWEPRWLSGVTGALQSVSIEVKSTSRKENAFI